MTTKRPVALLTGASHGLGRALARTLAADGWRLVIDARGAGDLNSLARELAGRTTVRAIPGDIADDAHRHALIAAVADLGRLDLLVNNASTLGPTPLPHLDAADLDAVRAVYDVNVIAPLALTQLALPWLREADTGTIVNITSDAAVDGYEGWGAYGSSKAALEQWGNVLAAEEPNVRVYTFDPGDMRTQMHQNAFPGEDISDRPEPETVVPAFVALLHTLPPSGRFRAADLAVVTP
jgi:NAD(P)-dependent dehydrogenase (short-subunit alcohol dehydrogenase family)